MQFNKNYGIKLFLEIRQHNEMSASIAQLLENETRPLDIKAKGIHMIISTIRNEFIPKEADTLNREDS